MRILGKVKIEDAKRKHPAYARAIDAWVRVIEGCRAKDFVQLRNLTYRSVDYVKPYTVFDVAGNHLRIVTIISFTMGQVTVEHVLTHKEYDKGKWK